MGNRRASTAILLLSLLAAPALASVRYVQRIGGGDSLAALRTACAAATAPACAEELAAAGAEAASLLGRLAGRSEVDVRALARRAADSASAELRVAAAKALGTPYATAAETPILAELADDPVPAVRAAALEAMASSNDAAAQALSSRGRAFGGSANGALGPNAPPAVARLGVPLPADAVFLFFASDPEQGRYVYSSAQAPDQVIAALRGKGKGPLTLDEFRAQTMKAQGEKAAKKQEADPDNPFAGMPSPEDMERMMKMAEAMNKAAESAQGQSPEAMAKAMENASKGMASLDAGLADRYDNDPFFASPRLFVVSLADGGEAVVAVYADRVLGTTGVAVHRAPIEGN